MAASADRMKWHTRSGIEPSQAGRALCDGRAATGRVVATARCWASCWARPLSCLAAFLASFSEAPKRNVTERRRTWDRHRVASTLVALSWLVWHVTRVWLYGLYSLSLARMPPGLNAACIAGATGALAAALPLAAIWFADDQQRSPPSLVRAFGWVALLVVTWGRDAMIFALSPR
jgi:hypothetical protein